MTLRHTVRSVDPNILPSGILAVNIKYHTNCFACCVNLINTIILSDVTDEGHMHAYETI